MSSASAPETTGPTPPSGAQAERPGTIDAVPVRHPWRWVTIAVILALVFLLVRLLLTNDAFNWSFVWQAMVQSPVLNGLMLGTLLGTVTICPEGSAWREIGLADEGEFRMLAVAPKSRGRGIGRALTEFCLDRFREVGASAIVLSTLPEIVAAHRVYELLGFVRTPERDWRPYPETLLITYRKDLA